MNDRPDRIEIYAPSPVAGKALAAALAARGVAAEYAGEAAGFRLMRGDGSALEIASPARLGHVIGRVQGWLAGGPALQSLIWGAYTLDMAGKEWKAGAETVSLTDRETALLAALIRAEGHALSRAAILSQVWEYHEDAQTHTLETHIYRLRRKIEADAAAPRILLTDGAGYRLGV